MYRSLALAALLAVSASPVLAQPTASLPSGFTFVDWLSTGRTETVGVGAVNTSSTVFYVKEKARRRLPVVVHLLRSERQPDSSRLDHLRRRRRGRAHQHR
jgi:hypothetical protein